MSSLPARLEVHKFGGTSVGSAARMHGIAALLRPALERASVVIVASAMAGVTDSLLKTVDLAARGELKTALEGVRSLRSRHLEALEALREQSPVQLNLRLVASHTHELASVMLHELERLIAELTDILRAVAALEELTPRARDRVLSIGEKLSVRVLSLALVRQGIPAVPVDADTCLETDQHFGEASALAFVAHQSLRSTLLPLTARGEIPVVTGFIGRAPDGATTTLGRGGSDLSATLIAAALQAAEVTIWTDVEGVFSADPRVVAEARLIPQLHYREASELSFYGAKVLHPRTIMPVARLGIPIVVRSSFEVSERCTVVDRRFTPGSHPVKAISAIREHALLSIEGKGMAGIPGVAARVFQALADRHISVTMISQSSSEASICLAVPSPHAIQAELALKQTFREDLARGDVEEVVVRQGVGLVAVVGLGMADTPGVAARVFTALSRRKINILAIAQGSSELNISLAVDRSRVDDALNALHAEFRLDRLDTGEDSSRTLDILLFGCGQIGRALIELLLSRHTHIFDRFGLSPRIVAIADRSGFLFQPNGLSQSVIEAALATKGARRRLLELPGVHATSEPLELIRHAMAYRLSRPVLVDVSDARESGSLMLEALRLGCDVVTANKRPLAGSLKTYEALARARTEGARLLKAEATVGAGLPIMDTLEMLLHTGDRLHFAEGCLSGTLGFLCTRLEEGALFSEAVEEAIALGYTEPDPVADLSGADVGRKALILGRMSGLVREERDLELSGLVDPALADLSHSALILRLREYNTALSQRVHQARERGDVLRYVARVEPGRLQVGLAEVPMTSPIGALKGTDNLILFQSDRYHERPLVVVGPGAGSEVTAMGVLSDLLRVAAERR